MKNKKKILTNAKNKPKKLLIKTALDAYLLLSKVYIQQGNSTVEISAKTGISKQAHYRYLSKFKSQKQVQPSVTILQRLAAPLGYEIMLVEKVDKKNKIVNNDGRKH